MARKKKIVSVPIRTTEDLLNLINHNVDATEKMFAKLGKKNRRIGIISAFAVVFALCTASECRKQDDEIYKLSLRLDKLENKEGE